MIIRAANMQKRSEGTLPRMTFNVEETKDIMEAANATGYLLMTWYIGISTQTNPNMEDSHMAKLLDLSVPTVERTRLALTKAGWFKRNKLSKNGKTHIIYTVGKNMNSSFGAVRAKCHHPLCK